MNQDRIAHHAADRAASRLTPDIREWAVQRAVEYAERNPTDRHAVRVARTGRMHGEAWSTESNGQDVWAIIERGIVRTFMYRRATQPTTPNAFNVQHVELGETPSVRTD